MSTPEMEAVFDQFKNFPTSNQYEETLSCVSAAMSAPEISSSPSDSPSSEAFSSESSSMQSSPIQAPSIDSAALDLQRLLAASALITKLEAICSAGVLPIADEMSARELIVKATKAFRFETQAERGVA